MEIVEKEIYFYQTLSGVIPFEEWLYSLDDFRARDLARARLARLRASNFGDSKFVGEGVFELRIFYGPGLRIYFAKISSEAILILNGGYKSTQKRDIRRAQIYWNDYGRRT